MDRFQLMARRVAGVVLIGALVACLPVSAHAAKKPRPDLVVTKGSRQARRTTFGELDNQEVRLAARTKNKGEAKAKASETWVVLRERTDGPNQVRSRRPRRPWARFEPVGRRRSQGRLAQLQAGSPAPMTH